MPIPNISPLSLAQGGAQRARSGAGFGDAMERMLHSLNADLEKADAGAEAVAKGEGDIQGAVLGMVQAELDLHIYNFLDRSGETLSVFPAY